jgi:DNA polymerase-3 subunit epsilon
VPATGAGPITTLSRLPVLLLDAQATAASPLRGALLEIGWALQAAGAPHLAPTEVASHVVAAPPGALLPTAVARITGLTFPEWEHGLPPEQVWQRLLLAASGSPVAPPLPTVIHYARFEEPFLRALHERHGHGDFPFRLLCTHAIARRLLPELPRRTLRALAGYFGAGVPPLRRSAEHVAATACVWRHLVARLGEHEGIASIEDLEAWLRQAVRRSPRQWPLPRERRRELPERPGVYRLLRAGGAVLYVGKATCLRQRVNGHFHAGAGFAERALDMLTQARDVSWSETETPLEAALLEADEIKRLAPPFNVALTAQGRAVWFASSDLRSVRQAADAGHVVGPLLSRAPIDALVALHDVLDEGRPAGLGARSRALGMDPPFAPDPECFAAGLALFVGVHAPGASTRSLTRLGARLWGDRLTAAAAKGSGPDPEPPDEAPRRPAWDPGRVKQALEESLLRAAHVVRRGRWLCRLSESSLAWAEPGAPARRLLVVQEGQVALRRDLEPGGRVPVPPGHARTLAERRASIDVAAFDRLRVLTTELRVLAAAAGPLELRLGPHARLSRPRLQAVLRWV